MDVGNVKIFLNDFFENIPKKDVFEKCLIELIIEKNKTLSNEDYDKNLIDKIDKIIESIQIYLSVATK